jgi:hypothetical protein
VSHSFFISSPLRLFLRNIDRKASKPCEWSFMCWTWALSSLICSSRSSRSCLRSPILLMSMILATCLTHHFPLISLNSLDDGANLWDLGS